MAASSFFVPNIGPPVRLVTRKYVAVPEGGGLSARVDFTFGQFWPRAIYPNKT